MRDLRLFGFREHSCPSTAIFATRTAISSAVLLSTNIRKVNRTKAREVEIVPARGILCIRSSRPAQIVNRSADLGSVSSTSQFGMWSWHDEGAHPRTLPAVIRSRLLGLRLAAFTATAASRPTVPAARFSCHQRPVICVSFPMFFSPTRAGTTHPPLSTKTFELQAPIATHDRPHHMTIPADRITIRRHARFRSRREFGVDERMLRVERVFANETVVVAGTS